MMTLCVENLRWTKQKTFCCDLFNFQAIVSVIKSVLDHVRFREIPLLETSNNTFQEGDTELNVIVLRYLTEQSILRMHLKYPAYTVESFWSGHHWYQKKCRFYRDFIVRVWPEPSLFISKEWCPLYSCIRFRPCPL